MVLVELCSDAQTADQDVVEARKGPLYYYILIIPKRVVNFGHPPPLSLDNLN
jgi:hypothetical protein